MKHVCDICLEHFESDFEKKICWGCTKVKVLLLAKKAEKKEKFNQEEMDFFVKEIFPVFSEFVCSFIRSVKECLEYVIDAQRKD